MSSAARAISLPGRWRALGADHQRRVELAQGGNDRERGDPAGLWIVTGDVLDRHREVRRVGRYANLVAIAGDRRISPHLHRSTIRADTGERQGGYHVDVGREGGCGLPRRSLEDASRGDQIV